MISKHKKIFLWAARGMGILLVAFLIFILVSPMLINLESAKEKILIHFSEQTGGQLHYEKVDLFYFPRPHAVIHQASLSIPGNVTGTLANLKIYPAIFSLFTGDIRISRLQLITPNFNIKLLTGLKERKVGISPSSAREMLANALAYPALNKPSFLIGVKDGRLNLYDENDVSFKFININANTRLILNRLTIDLTCKSNLWKNISIKGLINPHLFTSKGQVDLTHFNPKILIDYLFPDTVLKVSDAGINLNIGYKLDKHHVLHTKVQSLASYLTLFKGNENISIKVKNLACKLDMDEEETTVSLSRLLLDYPKLSASGEFFLNRRTKRISLDINARNVDVVSTRKVALAAAENSGITKDIFDIVKGGNIPEITFKSYGRSPADMGKIENIFIRGKLRDGNIFIPAALLDLEDVDGSVTISNGILMGENIKARLGNSFGTKGVLELGFEDNLPFYVETVIQADLSQLPEILERLVENKPFLKELSQIEEFQGSALGKMILDGDSQSVDVGVYASEIDLHARYGRIPYPMQIKGDNFSYKGTQLSFDKLNADIGKSTFSQLSGGITWKYEPHIEVKSGPSGLQMEEIYPWLLSFENFASVLKDFKTIEGLVTLDDLDLNGPIFNPKNLRIRMNGEVENIVINSTIFKDPISIFTGKFNAVESTSPGAVENNFIIESASLALGESNLAAQGSIILSKESLWIYMELEADSTNWEKVDQIIEYVNKKEEDIPDDKPWLLPVQGVLRIKSKHFTLGDFTFNPAHADIFLKHDRIFIDFTKANLCGISVPGSVKISRRDKEFYFYPVAENQKLDPALACLLEKNRLAIGNFDLSGKLFAESNTKEIGRSLNGNLKFYAEDGRIYRYGILAKIFALLNVTEIFKGKLPDVVKEGFAYSSIKAEGDVKKGEFSFKKCVIDGSSMTIVCEGYIDLIREKMDIVVLVAPFKTVDSIIKHIPIVNHIFGGKLISIPFRVTGNPANPTVTPLPPTAVGAGVFGILKRTLELPIKIFQPILPDQNKIETEPTDEQKFP